MPLIKIDSPNDVTLDVYSRNIDEYLRHTTLGYNVHHTSMLRWIDASLSHVPPGSAILEIGSAHGRDASYMSAKGYRVQCSDASKGFVMHLKSKGVNTKLLNIIKGAPSDKYNMVFANAVVPHFTQADFKKALVNISTCLETGGIFSFNVKQGDGSIWIKEKIAEERFINYWQPNDLINFVENSGYAIIFIEADLSGGDIRSHKWTHVVAKKNG